MQILALLRGVTPNGKNKIPKMSYVVEILNNAGFERVQTYIQSGNILLETNLSHEETASKIHNIIFERIGADLSVIIKSKGQLDVAIKENPFDDSYDFTRIHLVFTNNKIDTIKVNKIKDTAFSGELFFDGNECFYMYLPRDSEKKKLNNNYLEKHTSIVSTTRKLSVITHLHNMLEE